MNPSGYGLDETNDFDKSTIPLKKVVHDIGANNPIVNINNNAVDGSQNIK